MKRRVRHGDPQRQSYWEEVVRRWSESGQSVRGFCRGEGLRESAFYCWRRELARRSQRAGAVNGARPPARLVMPAARSLKQASLQRSSAPPFLPVRVVEDSVAEATCGVEIILAHGRIVRVRSRFDRQTLADVLAVLEVQPC